MFRSAAILLLSIFLFTSCARRVDQANADRPVTSSADDFVTAVSDPGADAAEPAVAADAAGNICLTYVVHNADKTADIFFQKFAPDSKPLGEKVRVNPAPGTVKAWRGDPPTVKVGKDGTVFIGWTVKVDSGEKPANDLVLSVSRDGGKSFEAPVRVNDDTAPASHGMHSLELDKDGRVYVAWLDERNVKVQPDHHDAPAATSMMLHHKEEVEPNSEVFFSVSTDGGKTFSPNKKLASEVCPCCKTSMAVGPDGKLYISWRQVLPNGYRHIAVASSPAGGGAFSTGKIVRDDKWKIDACPVSGSSMLVGANGVLVISWYTAGEAGAPGVYATRSLDGGNTFEECCLISGDAVSGTPVLVIDPHIDGALNVFAAKENGIGIRRIDGSFSTIRDGGLPAATLAGDKTVVAFVRTEGEKRSVLLRVLGL